MPQDLTTELYDHILHNQATMCSHHGFVNTYGSRVTEPGDHGLSYNTIVVHNLYKETQARIQYKFWVNLNIFIVENTSFVNLRRRFNKHSPSAIK